MYIAHVHLYMYQYYARCELKSLISRRPSVVYPLATDATNATNAELFFTSSRSQGITDTYRIMSYRLLLVRIRKQAERDNYVGLVEPLTPE